MPVHPSEITIDFARDYLFDKFALDTFRDRYQLPGEAGPQIALARACAAFADDAAHAQRLYDYVSNHWFMFASPLLSNGGSERGLPISCFLQAIEDSREGIFDAWAETGWLSSIGGGVGGYWGGVRSAGEETGRGSSSTGIIPFIATVDRIMLAVSQGKTRRGAYAAYLDVDHPEIEEFCTIRKPTGGDANRKATNLNNAINITDEFMRAVEADEPFHLRSPKTRAIIKTVRARDLWRLILETRLQNGEPYLHFIDASNRALPAPQKAKGLKVRQSNLCVAPFTEVLTEEGYRPIAGLVGQAVKVWNGAAWSEVTVQRTADAAELVRVWFADGDYLDCTPYHKFYLADGSVVRAGELRKGAALEASNHPIIPASVAKTTDEAYIAGWATVGGFLDKNRLAVSVPNTAPTAARKRLLSLSMDAISDEFTESTTIHYEAHTIAAGSAPTGWGHAARAWVAGALDAVGEAATFEGEAVLAFAVPDRDLIRQIRLAALSAGLRPVIRLTKTLDALIFTGRDLQRLFTEGLLAREPVGISRVRVPTIARVEELPWTSPTYCFTEAARGRGVFGGYLTGNCTEITLPTGIDDTGRRRTAVCCLSSVNAEKYDLWRDEPRFIPDLMRMLDNALQVFIDRATDQPGLEAAAYSAMMERSIGLGLMGFHAYLQLHRVPFESQEARAINEMMFSRLREGADHASRELATERGEAPDMLGTGERFAHKLAIAPNASSSILCGDTSASIEPRPANAYLHKTLDGSFVVKNRYLKAALAELGMDTDETWSSITAYEGSVQHLDISEHLKAVFRTAFELDQRWIIRHAADRQPYICQAQSVNLFFAHDANPGVINDVHFMAWKARLKSLYYFRSSTPKRGENVNTKVARKEIDLGTLVAAAAADDDGCLSCQG